jgi:glycosyltransferase involved in cell wall biosynthesis
VTDEGEIKRVRSRYGLKGDYILAVGPIQPRKNLVRLLAGYARLRRSRPNARIPPLVVVGKRAWLYQETFQTIQDQGIANRVVFTG